MMFVRNMKFILIQLSLLLLLLAVYALRRKQYQGAN